MKDADEKMSLMRKSSVEGACCQIKDCETLSYAQFTSQHAKIRWHDTVHSNRDRQQTDAGTERRLSTCK